MCQDAEEHCLLADLLVQLVAYGAHLSTGTEVLEETGNGE